MNAPNRTDLAQRAFDAYQGPKTVANELLDDAKRAVLMAICAEVNTIPPANFGLLKKTDQGDKIASDILVWSDTMEHFDVLSDREVSPGISQILYARWNAKGVLANPRWVWAPVLTVPATPGPVLPPPPSDGATAEALVQEMKAVLGQLADVLRVVAEGQTALASKLDAIAGVVGNTAANVSEALTIAREIHSHTASTSGSVQGLSDQVHNVTRTIGTVANDLSPLLNLLAALKGGPIVR